MAARRVNIGVLAIQGGVTDHIEAVKKAAEKLQATDTFYSTFKFNAYEIRRVDQVNDDLDGLILPGGESTVMTEQLKKDGFLEQIRTWTRRKEKFTWGTCAGLIMLSKSIDGAGKDAVSLIGGLDITCVRNAFGRQINSFEGGLRLTDEKLSNAEPNFTGVFIRAPGVKSIDSEAVTVLCRFPEGVSSCGTGNTLSDAVGVRQDNVMACSFHPELTGDGRWHEYFIKEMIQQKTAGY